MTSTATFRGKGNLSKEARTTGINPYPYFKIEEWSNDPILVSLGFSFIAKKYPSVFGECHSDLRTKCQSRAYHLIAQANKTRGYKRKIDRPSTWKINQSVEKLDVLTTSEELDVFTSSKDEEKTLPDVLPDEILVSTMQIC